MDVHPTEPNTIASVDNANDIHVFQPTPNAFNWPSHSLSRVKSLFKFIKVHSSLFTYPYHQKNKDFPQRDGRMIDKPLRDIIRYNL